LGRSFTCGEQLCFSQPITVDRWTPNSKGDVDALQRYDQKSGKYPARWGDLGPRYNQ
jgi:hypothetical protein